MTIAKQIENRLLALGLSANEASVKAGLPRGFVGDILSGKSKHPRADSIMRLATALECDPGYLLTSDETWAPVKRKGAAPVVGPEIMMPVRFEVAAGAWKEHEDYDTSGEVEMMPATLVEPFQAFPQWLERVRGDSMDRIIPADSLVHVVDAIAMHYVPADGDIVVVERTRAQGALVERSLKQLAVLKKGGLELWPRSHNPRWDKPLVLAEHHDNDDDTVVQIVGLVIRSYQHFRLR